MLYTLTIDCATLGALPLAEIANLLQTQAEKVLRWQDSAEWSDTIVDHKGEKVGVAALVADEPVSPMLQAVIETLQKAPPAEGQTVRYEWANGSPLPRVTMTSDHASTSEVL